MTQKIKIRDYIESIIPAEVRVKYISLTIFIFDVLDSYTIELEDHVKSSGMYRGKVMHHVKEIRRHSNEYNHSKLKSIPPEYRDFLLEQIDEKEDEMNNDFKILLLSMKSYLDKFSSDGVKTKIIALASMCLILATCYHQKEEEYADFFNSVNQLKTQIREYKVKNMNIANIERHSRLLIELLAVDVDANLNDSEEIQQSWDILGRKIAGIELDLNYEK